MQPASHMRCSQMTQIWTGWRNLSTMGMTETFGKSTSMASKFSELRLKTARMLCNACFEVWAQNQGSTVRVDEDNDLFTLVGKILWVCYDCAEALTEAKHLHQVKESLPPKTSAGTRFLPHKVATLLLTDETGINEWNKGTCNNVEKWKGKQSGSERQQTALVK